MADDRIDREEARRYLIDAFNALSPKTQNMVWGGWLLNVSNLGFAELTDKAAILIQDGRMPERWTSEACFRKDMSENVSDRNPVARYEEMGIKPFSNIVEQLSEWASFKQESVASPSPNQTDNIVTNIFRQIGRNDPCPCGSGKKYKKCCLHL